MKQANTTTHLRQACPQWAEKLNAIHRDDLPFEERVELRKHLETCANCQAVRGEYRALDALITGLPQVEPLATIPARLRDLTGMHEEAAQGSFTDDAREMPQIHIPVRKQPFPSRLRQFGVKLNLAAAVLVVAAIVAGFFVLHPAHFSHGVSSQGSSRHATGLLHHSTYLDVIIGNGHGDSYAVDPSNGTVVWKHQVMTEPIGNPFSADGILYYAGVNNVLYAIDGGNGQPLWHDQLAPANQNNQISSRVVAEGDLIFVTTINFPAQSLSLSALDAYTGNISWQKHLKMTQNLVLLSATDNVLYAESDGLSAWSTQDGHLLWKNSQLSGPAWNSSTSGTPLIVANGKLYFFQGPRLLQGSGGPFVESNLIDVVEASTGQLLHTISINTANPQPMGFAVEGGILYAAMNNGSGTPSLQAYRLSDEHLLWHKTYNGRLLTLSAANGQIYVGLQVLNVSHPATKNPADYSTWLIALQSNGSEFWRWSDPAGFGMVAAVEINGVVCVVDGGVVGVRASDGHQLWRTNFSQATGFPPTID